MRVHLQGCRDVQLEGWAVEKTLVPSSMDKSLERGKSLSPQLCALDPLTSLLGLFSGIREYLMEFRPQ